MRILADIEICIENACIVCIETTQAPSDLISLVLMPENRISKQHNYLIPILEWKIGKNK